MLCSSVTFILCIDLRFGIMLIFMWMNLFHVFTLMYIISIFYSCICQRTFSLSISFMQHVELYKLNYYTSLEGMRLLLWNVALWISCKCGLSSISVRYSDEILVDHQKSKTYDIYPITSHSRVKAFKINYRIFHFLGHMCS